MDVCWSKLPNDLNCLKNGKTSKMGAGNKELTIGIEITSEYFNLNLLCNMLHAIMLLICHSYAYLPDLSTFKSQNRLGCAACTASQLRRMNLKKLSNRNLLIFSLLICTLFACSSSVNTKELTDFKFEDGLLHFSLNRNRYTMVELNIWKCYDNLPNFPNFEGCKLYLASDGSIYQFKSENFTAIRNRMSLRKVTARLINIFVLFEMNLISDPNVNTFSGAVVTNLSTSREKVPLLNNDEMKLIQNSNFTSALKQIGRVPIVIRSAGHINKEVLYMIVGFKLYPIEIPDIEEEIRHLEIKIDNLYQELGENQEQIKGLEAENTNLASNVQILSAENQLKQMQIETLESANQTLALDLAKKQTLVIELEENQIQNLNKIEMLERQLSELEKRHKSNLAQKENLNEKQAKKTQNMTIIISVVLSAIIVMLIVTLTTKFVGCPSLRNNDKVPTRKDPTLGSERRVENPYFPHDQNMDVLNH